MIRAAKEEEDDLQLNNSIDTLPSYTLEELAVFQNKDDNIVVVREIVSGETKNSPSQREKKLPI